jgi:hypothetical protein
LVLPFARQLPAASLAPAVGAGSARLGWARRLLPVALAAAATLAGAQEDHSEAEALSAGGVAGEIMDIAVEHCRRGEVTQALSMFAAMRAQLDPPPAILRLIQDLEASGCTRSTLKDGATLRVQLAGGWDSNVSQGISARTLVLGSGDNVLELELDESYRPRASSFVTASVDYGLVLPGSGISLQAALAHRKNLRESAFDLTSLSLSASREFKVTRGSLRAQVEFSDVRLGDRHYQRSESAAIQWLDAQPRGAWLATLSTTAAQYLTQPSQNSWQWEASLLRELQLNRSTSVHAAVSLTRDNATHSRPGGDRQGFGVQLGGVMLAEGWRVRPQLSYSSWNSAELFAPGLLDVRRENRLVQAVFQAERPFTPQTSLVLEWRGRWARDTVALYRYQARVISATLAHRF